MEWIHPNLHVRRLLGMAVVTIAMSLAGWWVFNLLTPPQHNPFKPLDLTLKPGIVTGFKLDGLKDNKSACFFLLDQAGVAGELVWLVREQVAVPGEAQAVDGRGVVEQPLGGGPTGVELAGAITELTHVVLREDFRRIDPSGPANNRRPESPMAFLDKLKNPASRPDRAAPDTRSFEMSAQAADERDGVQERSPLEINMDMERTVVLEGVGGRSSREFQASIITEAAPNWPPRMRSLPNCLRKAV